MLNKILVFLNSGRKKKYALMSLGLKKKNEKKKKMIEDFADLGDRRLSLVKFLLKIIFELTSYRRVSPILRPLHQRKTRVLPVWSLNRDGCYLSTISSKNVDSNFFSEFVYISPM